MISSCWRATPLRDPRPQPLKADSPDIAPASEFKDPDAKLDDVMLAMDVVDTLRHERMLIVRDINSEVRRETLVDRLRDIYKGQGIAVPDDILMDGVRALEEERFRYTPPKPGFGLSLAKFYINRGKWLPLVWTVIAVIGLAGAVNYLGFQRPAQIEQARIEQVMQSLPDDLQAAYSDAIDGVTDADILTRLERIFETGNGAITAGNAALAERSVSELEQLNTQLDLSYNLDIINQRGQMSGVIWDGVPYVVVEATGQNGAPISIPVTAPNGQTVTTSTFGVQVPQSVFERVANDFQDNDIVDEVEVAVKEVGQLEADYAISIGNKRLTDAAKWRAR